MEISLLETLILCRKGNLFTKQNKKIFIYWNICLSFDNVQKNIQISLCFHNFRILIKYIWNASNRVSNKWCASNTRSLLLTTYGMDSIWKVIACPQMLIVTTIWHSSQTSVQSYNRPCHRIKMNQNGLFSSFSKSVMILHNFSLIFWKCRKKNQTK